MLFQALLELADQGEFSFVCKDNNLARSLETNQSVSLYQDLAAFIASEGVQALIIEEESARKQAAEAEVAATSATGIGIDFDLEASLAKAEASVHHLLDGLRTLSSSNENELTRYVATAAAEELGGSDFYSSSIPGDDHRAYITLFDSLDSVEFDWDEALYHGSNTFTVPFDGSGHFYVTYYVSKWDIFELEERGVAYSEHNDHVVEAEEEVELSVSGTLRVRLREADPDDEFEDTLEELEIDSMEAPFLVGDEPQ
jgi:hypothetical protein